MGGVGYTAALLSLGLAMSPVPGFSAQQGLVATTLTGVDEHTDVARALDLSRRFPWLEWGVLLGGDPSPRYPSWSFIERWALACESIGAHSALHLCGAFARKWIENDPQVVALARLFARIQVNVVARRIDVDALVDAIQSGRHPRVITQHNHANEIITARLASETGHAVLFDASGGRGVAATQWPMVIPGKACGYAGGLSPENVGSELDKIAQVAGEAFWIDMEGRLRREDDTLNLDRCEAVLVAVSAWQGER